MPSSARAALEPQLAHDLAQAAEFLRYLDPSASKFTFQFFQDANADVHGRVAHAQIAHASLDHIWQTIQQLNCLHRMAGAFVTINETNLCGRTASDITRARALFADADGPDQVRRCREFIASTGCAPSAIVHTSRDRAHFYWWLADLERDNFKPLQNALARALQSDTAVSDISRVMRLPGTYNFKNPASPHLVRLESVSGKRWTTSEFLARTGLGAEGPSITPRGNLSSAAAPCSDNLPPAQPVSEVARHGNDELGAGIGDHWSIDDFANAAMFLAERRPSPLAIYSDSKELGWLNFTFACCYGEITRPEHAEVIRSI